MSGISYNALHWKTSATRNVGPHRFREGLWLCFLELHLWNFKTFWFWPINHQLDKIIQHWHQSYYNPMCISPFRTLLSFNMAAYFFFAYYCCPNIDNTHFKQSQHQRYFLWKRWNQAKSVSRWHYINFRWNT